MPRRCSLVLGIVDSVLKIISTKLTHSSKPDGIQRTTVKRKDRGVRPFDRDIRPCVDVLNDYMRVMMSHIIPQINQKQNNRYTALKKYHQLNRREIRQDILRPDHQKTVHQDPRPSTLTRLRYYSNPYLRYFRVARRGLETLGN